MSPQPCPACGSQEIGIENGYGRFTGLISWVECFNSLCQLRGPIGMDNDSRATAIDRAMEKWNRLRY